MKKIKYIVVLLLFFLVLVSCNSNNNRSVPKLANDSNPKIIDLGNVLVWTTNDDQYEVFCDNTSIEENSTGIYFLPETIENDSPYYVKNLRSGLTSNVINVKKNIFSDSEILSIANSESYSGIISSTIKKIIVGSKEHYDENVALSLVIDDRTDNLIVELNSVNVVGYIHSKNNNYKDSIYNIIIDNYGDSSIRSNDGRTGLDFSSSVYDDTESDAGAGIPAEDTLVNSKIVFIGSGNLGIYAGNGGNGGIGSGTTSESYKYPGRGSNGGDGGSAIKTSYLVVSSYDGSLNVKYKDGLGGQKGLPGVNGSIFSGPLASMVWGNYDNGVNGNPGKSYFGTKYILRGEFNAK